MSKPPAPPTRRTLIRAAGGAGGTLVLASATGRVWAAPATKPKVRIETDKGVMVLELEDKKAPITSANFLHYVDFMKYDGGQFYRASRGGAPGSGTIQGSANQKVRLFRPVDHEPTTQTGIKHRAGTISMARNKPGSATSDFFICASPQPYLDAHPGAKGDNLGFAAFGQVVDGMGTVRRILSLPTAGHTDLPEMKGQILTTPVKIISMKRV